MNSKKVICLLLLLVFTVIFGSCGDKTAESGQKDNQNEKEDSEKNEDGDSNTPETDPKEQYNPNFEPVDMKGYVFKFGTRDDDAPYHRYAVHTRDLYAETETGDLINDATYKRNRYVEAKYNCSIEMNAFQESLSETTANEIVEKSVKAGDKSYDMLMTHMMHGVNTSLKGCFYDIASFPNIDISKPYWNKGANEGCSVGHKLYMGLSDLSFSTNENLYCIFFNKKLLQDYGIENPYKIVAENGWTFDKFNDIIRTGYIDLNGNGKVDPSDQFGYVSSNALNFLWSGGSHMTKKDENDIPVFDFLTERTITIYDKAFNIANNEYTHAVGHWHHEPSIELFQEGRGVFFSNQLCRVNDLRATEFEFGIVPYPKLDSAQERYYSYVDGHASMMAIPLNLPNQEYTGIVIEELSFLSYRDIIPVYYDVVLNVKMVRDEESVEMLKILFDSKVFDPAYIMGLSLWGSWIDNIQNKKPDIVSVYEKAENTLIKTLNKNVETLLSLDS